MSKALIASKFLNNPMADEVGFLQAGTGAVSRNSQDKMREGVSVLDFAGVDPTGVTDSTAGFQSAVNFCVTIGADLVLPPGSIRLTAPITTAKGLRIIGSHPIAKGPGGTDVFLGSWLYFDHGGRGISAVNSLGTGTTGLCLESVGTRRNQPTPVPGWVPNDHDFDVYTFGFLDVTLRDCLLLNPTRGVAMFGNPTDTTGRLNVYDLKMQAFKVGIQVDVAYDVCRIDQLHVWPFWRDDMNVHMYCMNNLDAIWMLRNDNPMLSNLFTIFARSGIRFSQSVLGKTSKVHMTNADFDRGVYGVWIDGSCADG